MKTNHYFRNTALTVVLGLFLAVCRVIRSFVPLGVLPKLDLPTMILLCLAALVLDHYLVRSEKRCDVAVFLLAALTFFLLPWASGFAPVSEALILGTVGGVVFIITAWLFAQITDRLSTGPAAKAAPVISALGLYLAAQCLSGIIL